MELKLKHYGNSRITPSKIIELTIESNGNTIVEDLTNLKGLIDTKFIDNLRWIADELEEQNNLINNKNY